MTLRRPALFSLLLCSALSCNPKSTLRQKAPAIEVTPNPIFFQPLAAGKSAAVAVQVKNTGNIDLHLGKDPYVVEADQDNLVEYDMPSVLGKDCDGKSRPPDARLTIVPGDCAVLALRFSPQNTDKDDATLVFESDDPDHPKLSVPVGLGAPPHLQICTVNEAGGDGACDTPQTQPALVEFGIVAAGQSKTQKVRLRNVGTVPLGGLVVYDPAGVNGGEFARSANAPTALAVGGSVDVTVRFTPAGGGARTGFLQVDSADPTRPSAQIPLRGVTAGPALCVDPDPVDFGQGSAGTPSDKTVTLTSCGNVAVKLQQATFDTLSSPAFTSSALPAPQTLTAGAKLTFAVRFSPDDASDQVGAVLLPNDGQPDQFVRLHGTAVLPPTCHLEASSPTVSFGPVVRGQSAQRAVTVANRGAANCTLTAVQIVLGQSLFTVLSPPTSPVTLRPNDAFTSTVSYAPPASDLSASDTGTLEFDSNDPLHPRLQVSLNGQPVAQAVCKVNVAPAASSFGGFGGRILQFGNVVVGKTKTLPISITNVGGASCPIGSLNFVNGFGAGGGGTFCRGGTSCGEYKIVAPNVSSSLPPGQSTQINVAFTPTSTNQVPQLPTVYFNFRSGDAAAASECTTTLPADSSNGCVDVAMSGQGDISNLEVIPSDLDFGLVTLGCKSRTQTVTLYNTGASTPINIQGITLDPATAPYYVQAPPTPFAINAGAKVPFQVTYKPTQAAVESATLKIQSDASNTTSNNPYITVSLNGQGTTDKHQTDTFTQATVPKVDLLFVVDNSGSMQDKQASLSQQGPAFINEALKAKADFHIGVTTTENDQTDKPDSYASYGDTIYPGGLWGRPPIIDATDANAASDFSANIKVGTCCSDSRESGLESAWRVLSAPADVTAPPQGSKSFLRDDARLVMVAVSDEEDQSHGSTAFYTDFFQNVKGKFNAGLVSFNAIVGDPSTGCDNGSISAQAGNRYASVATSTGGKWYSICSADWSQLAKDLALGAFQGRKQFALSRTADPATVKVLLNGASQTVNADYVFDQPSNSVIFSTVPPPGATIVVDYDALCL